MNNEDQTFIILTPGFPESEADTTCLPMQQSLVRKIKQNYPGLNIFVLSFQYPYHKKNYRWYDTTVMSFDGKNKGGLARLLRRRKIISRLNEIKKDHRITGILSFWYGECAWIGKSFADKHNIRHYCWILGQDAREENKYPERVHAKANELIALSDFLQDEFERNHGIRPMHVIPAAVDLKQLSDIRQERDIDILAAGSLIPLKQYDVFVETVARIKKKLPAVKAAIIGDGSEKEKLQNLISRWGLQDNIRLTGELSHPEVQQLMQKAKIFLHTSSYEGFGVVLLEALQAGCHAVSFNKPMKQDFEHWYIAKSKEDMAGKALELLQSPGTVYKSVVPFTMDDTVKKIADLFEIA